MIAKLWHAIVRVTPMGTKTEPWKEEKREIQDCYLLRWLSDHSVELPTLIKVTLVTTDDLGRDTEEFGLKPQHRLVMEEAVLKGKVRLLGCTPHQLTGDGIAFAVKGQEKHPLEQFTYSLLGVWFQPSDPMLATALKCWCLPKGKGINGAATISVEDTERVAKDLGVDPRNLAKVTAEDQKGFKGTFWFNQPKTAVDIDNLKGLKGKDVVGNITIKVALHKELKPSRGCTVSWLVGMLLRVREFAKIAAGLVLEFDVIQGLFRGEIGATKKAIGLAGREDPNGTRTQLEKMVLSDVDPSFPQFVTARVTMAANLIKNRLGSPQDPDGFVWPVITSPDLPDDVVVKSPYFVSEDEILAVSPRKRTTILRAPTRGRSGIVKAAVRFAARTVGYIVTSMNIANKLDADSDGDVVVEVNSIRGNRGLPKIEGDNKKVLDMVLDDYDAVTRRIANQEQVGSACQEYRARWLDGFWVKKNFRQTRAWLKSVAEASEAYQDALSGGKRGGAFSLLKQEHRPRTVHLLRIFSTLNNLSADNLADFIADCKKYVAKYPKMLNPMEQVPYLCKDIIIPSYTDEDVRGWIRRLDHLSVEAVGGTLKKFSKLRSHITDLATMYCVATDMGINEHDWSKFGEWRRSVVACQQLWTEEEWLTASVLALRHFKPSKNRQYNEAIRNGKPAGLNLTFALTIAHPTVLRYYFSQPAPVVVEGK